MRRKYIFVLIVVMTVLLFSSCSPDVIDEITSFVNLTVQVEDENGDPVSGAVVELSLQDGDNISDFVGELGTTGTTDNDGRLTFLVKKNTQYIISVIFTDELKDTYEDSSNNIIDVAEEMNSQETIVVNFKVINQKPVAENDTETVAEDESVLINLLANDSDPDGDTITVDSFTQPANGVITDNEDGTVTYKPEANYNGDDSFDYTISDGELTDTATVSITVDPVNDAPVLTAIGDKSVSENEELTFTVDATDVEGDTLTYSATGDLAEYFDGATKTFSWKPAYGDSGNYSLTITVSDGELTDSETINISVGDVNRPPVAVDDSITTDEDTVYVFDKTELLANDSDPDGDSILFSSNGEVTHGTLTDNQDGTLTYTPKANYNGDDSFDYTISDGELNDTATVNITINAIDDLPVLEPIGNKNVDEDQTLTFTVTASDVDGDEITLNVNNKPVGASFTSSPANPCSGIFEFTPSYSQSGSYSLTFEATANGKSVDEAITIKVNDINRSPIAENDDLSTNEDTELLITLSELVNNDSDPDGDSLSITNITTPSNGEIVDNGDGTATYIPDENYNGEDSFSYTISDGKGETDTATVNITIDAVNDTPVATDDSGVIDEDTSILIDVLANDTDVDGDTLTVTEFIQGTNGKVTQEGDSLRYTPDNNYNGTDTFEYTVSDGNGGIATGTVNVTINAINDAPVFTAIDDQTVNENEELTFTVDATDVEGDILTYSATGDLAEYFDGATKTFSWKPAYGDSGNYSITITVSDGNLTSSIIIKITVGDVNRPPVAVDDSITTDEDSAYIIDKADLIANDSDPDGDSIVFSSNSEVTHGTLIDNQDGTLTYTPEANYNGDDSFDYTISDGELNDTATVQITINPVNDDPVAVDDYVTINEDETILIDVLGNDIDIDGDNISFDMMFPYSAPSYGSVEIVDNKLEYTPDKNYYGTDSFTYMINDGNSSDDGIVSITINAVDDLPIVDTVGDKTVDEGQTLTFTVTASDVDGDEITLNVNNKPVGASFTSSPANPCSGIFEFTPSYSQSGSYSLTFEATANGKSVDEAITIKVNDINRSPIAENDNLSTNEDTELLITLSELVNNDSDPDGDSLTITNVTSPNNGSLNDNGDGTVTYIPDEDYNGEDSFTYDISDGNGGTATGTVIITINPINDAPVAGNDTVTTDEDVELTIDFSNLLLNDSDVDGDMLSVTNVTSPTNGVLVDNGDGTATYTPDENYNGADSFTYTISDGNGETDTATVDITIDSVNDAPVAVNDSGFIDEDGSLSIDVLANDSDIEGDTLSIAEFTQGTNGTVAQEGDSLRYTPDNNYNGTDTFEYTVSDGNGGTDTASVNMTINPINDLPLAVDNNVTLDEDGNILIDVLANDTDIDGDTLSITGFTQGTNGAVVQEGDNLRYTPDADFNGADSFTYDIGDGKGGIATGTVNVTVNAVDDPPVLDPIGDKTVDENQTLSFTVSATDIENHEISYSMSSEPALPPEASLDSSTSVFSWTTTYADQGDYEVIFTATANGLNDSETITLTVNDMRYWQTVGTQGFSSNTIYWPDIYVDNGIPYLGYREGGLDVQKFNGTSWESVGAEDFASPADWTYTSLYVDNGIPYISFRDSNNNLGVMKYDGNWTDLGYTVDYFVEGSSISVDSGVPYVAVFDGLSIEVKKYNGSNWEAVGPEYISQDADGSDKYKISLDVDNGIPYLVYSDANNGNKATVIKFENDSWEPVGSTGVISDGDAKYTTISVYNGIPYVAYKDGANSGKATVKKFSGSSWQVVGTEGFSNPIDYSFDFDIFNGVAYIAYDDGSTGKAGVMKFNGSNWETVGTTNVSSGSIGDIAISVDNGVAYVGYQDSSVSAKATVRKFDY